MDFPLIDHFRMFHELSKEYELSASARSVYFALLGEFNAAFWPDELKISDRSMLELSGVKSTATVHDARNLLKLMNLIDFRKGKNRKTIYKILNKARDKQSENTNRTPTESSNEQSALFLMSSCGLVGKTEDERQSQPPPPREGQTTKRGLLSVSKNEENAEEYDIDEIVEEWTESPCFSKLDFELITEIANLVKKHGKAKVKEAMGKAKRANNNRNGVSFAFFKAILEKESEKGGEKNEEDPRGKWTFGNK